MESQHPKDVTFAAIAAVHELVPQIAVLAKIPDWLRMQSWRCPELARPSAWFQGEDGSWAAIVEALNRPKGGKLRAVYDLLVAMGLPIYDYVSLDWDHRGTRRKFYRTTMAGECRRASKTLRTGWLSGLLRPASDGSRTDGYNQARGRART